MPSGSMGEGTGGRGASSGLEGEGYGGRGGAIGLKGRGAREERNELMRRGKP